MKKTTKKQLTDANELIEYLKATKQQFDVTVSNYTMKITGKSVNIKYLTDLKSRKTFLAFQKLKQDVATIKPPTVIKERLQYFHHNFRNPAFYSTVVNIDLRNAYAMALFRAGVISWKNYKLLLDLDKPERLASVGMLASRKYIFHYKNGNIVDVDKVTSQTENFFYYAVSEVQRLMRKLKLLAGENYLFTWVDGIYFQNEDNTAQRLTAYLKQMSIDYSIELLQDFDVSFTDRGAVKLSFMKDTDEKVFAIPPVNNEFNEFVFDYLMKKHSKNANAKTGFARKQTDTIY